MLLLQKTVRSSVIFEGKGLHSGRMVRLEVRPAGASTGIIFKRTDTHSTPVAAHIWNVSDTKLSTTLGSAISSVSTVEHLLAALYGLGIDNALVFLNGPEVPILDGSAQPFVRKLLSCGIKTLNEPKKFLRLARSVNFSVAQSRVIASPANNLQLRCAIDFKEACIGRQEVELHGGLDGFQKVAGARTFCRLQDIQFMRSRGLALGGSLDNAIVVDGDRVLNQDGLRDPKEFVHHKLLDLMGDLALLGAPLIGRLEVTRPGHDLHAQFMRHLMEAGSNRLEEIKLDHSMHKCAQFQEEAVGLPESQISVL